jgi:hypothetical protein
MMIDTKDFVIRDEVLVETEIDGLFVELAAFVTNVLADELWLAVHVPDPRLGAVAVGQRLHLTFDRGGKLTTESEFLRRLGGTRLGTQKSRVFAIRKPQDVESLQRRAHVRVDLERTIRLRSLADGPESKGIGKTVNIGVGGVKFATSMPLVFGEQLRLALVLTPHDIVVAGGPVVRIEEPANPATEVNPVALAGTGRLRMVAVRFDSITEVDRERIACHILAAHRRRPAEPRPTVAAPVAKVPAPPAESPIAESPSAPKAPADARD